MNRILQWFQADSGVSTVTTDDRQFIRERILKVVLIGSALLGAVAYYINIRPIIAQGTWGWAIIYTLAFSWICAVAFISRIPYAFRAYSFLTILYALGITSALQYGAAGDARIWFVGLVVLASIFVGTRGGISMLVLTVSSYLLIGWLTHQGTINIPDPGTFLNFDNFASWTTTGISYFAISVVIVISVGVLVNGLNSGIKKNRELAKELTFDREKLENRSKALERREVQIRTAAEISRTAVAELDPHILFQRVVELVQSRFNLYYVGVFVVDPSGHYANLQAGTGEAGQRMLARKHRLAIGSTSMIGYAISNKEARIASDVGLDAHRFDNPDLPETRSELALPMISGERVLGALTVQSTLSSAFDQNDIIVLQGIADSLATALENANLFQQLQASLQEVQAIQKQYLQESWSNVLAKSRSLSHTYTSESPNVDGQSHFSATSLDFPLILRDQIIGNLSLETDRSNLTPQERGFIDAVIKQTTLALENVRLVEETQRTAQQERIVGTISEELSRVMDVENVIKIAVRELGRLPNINEVSIFIEPDQQ
ncbi:MAG TPA: hypothetical protein DEH22_09100 [Chloroflexi bacterium]|nr:hypothetical protein [Chloroflexota bacterium]